MNNDYDLFGGLPPYQKESDTSKAAAIGIKESVSDLQMRVLRMLAGLGEKGATDHQLVKYLNRIKDTVAPRRRELYLKGLVEDSGLRRETPSGKKATVWRVSLKGWRYLREYKEGE